MRNSTDCRDAVGYIRVSSRKQVEGGESLTTQDTLIRRYAAERGLRIRAIFRDAGRSGRSTKRRDAVEQAVEATRELHGTLIVHALTRFARSVPDTYTLVDRVLSGGGEFVSVSESFDTSTAIGRAMLGMLAVCSQFESDLMGERIRTANREQVLRDGFRRQGVQPYGWRVDEHGRRVVDEEEREVIDEVLRLREAKATFKEIADRLNLRGVPTMRAKRGHVDGAGTKWKAGTLYQIVARERPDLLDLATRHPPFDWTDDHVALLGTMTDKALAERLKISRAMVIRRRLKLGIPPFFRRTSTRDWSTD